MNGSSRHIATLLIETSAFALVAVVFGIFLIIYFIFLKQDHERSADICQPTTDHLIQSELIKEEEQAFLAAQQLHKSARNMTTDELRQKWTTAIQNHDDMVKVAAENVDHK